MNLDDLKNRIKEIPISQVIGQYLTLTRTSNSILAVCPFHDDHRPSLHINDQRNMFKCFVDDIGGDALTFVMKYKNLSFINALEDICDKVGINFEDYVKSPQQSPRDELGKKIMKNAVEIYKKLSLTSSEFAHFLKDRGLNQELAKKYELGFATKNNTIIQYLMTIKDPESRKKAIQMAEELGLIKKSKSSKDYYDTFRERIIFPIWDSYGRPIGMTSRSIRENQNPKYMNSKDSFLFNKKSLLYGLHLGKKEILSKNRCFLVEGNMDQIAFAKAHLLESVAIMGIALGDHSLKTIKSLTSTVYLALDNDDAGFKAMERINSQFLNEKIIPFHLNLSPSKDPDDFLKTYGIIELQKRIDEARPFIDVQTDKLFPKEVPSLTDRKLELLEKFFEIFLPLGDDLSATERIVTIAKKLGLTSAPLQIVESYQNFIKQERPERKNATHKESSAKKIISSEKKTILEDGPQPSKQKLKKSDKVFLSQILQHPECMESKEFESLLDFVLTNEVKVYALELRNLIHEIDEQEYPTMAMDLLRMKEFSVDLLEFVGSTIYNYRPKRLDSKKVTRLVSDLQIKLKKQFLKDKRIELKAKQKTCLNEEENLKVVTELFEIEKSIIMLQNKNHY